MNKIYKKYKKAKIEHLIRKKYLDMDVTANILFI